MSAGCCNLHARTQVFDCETVKQVCRETVAHESTSVLRARSTETLSFFNFFFFNDHSDTALRSHVSDFSIHTFQSRDWCGNLEGKKLFNTGHYIELQHRPDPSDEYLYHISTEEKQYEI